MVLLPLDKEEHDARNHPNPSRTGGGAVSSVEERAEARAAYEAQEKRLRERVGTPFVDWTDAPDVPMRIIRNQSVGGRRSEAAQSHTDAVYEGSVD